MRVVTILRYVFAGIFSYALIFSIHAQAQAIKQVEQPKVGRSNNGTIKNIIPPSVAQPRVQGMSTVSGGFISTWCYQDGTDINLFFSNMNNELVKQNGFEPVDFKVVTIFNHSCILILHKRKY
jgi:hypothetical protein